jgi:hypothetical protein
MRRPKNHFLSGSLFARLIASCWGVRFLAMMTLYPTIPPKSRSIFVYQLDLNHLTPAFAAISGCGFCIKHPRLPTVGTMRGAALVHTPSVPAWVLV